ncbi:MAG: twin-arginine translocation signal domain-containing protein [Verrucomicrobia bacterium]|nr:twin-arginine translocation signal domain-containing protein [Verrucomicrobiota bacterium]
MNPSPLWNRRQFLHHSLAGTLAAGVSMTPQGAFAETAPSTETRTGYQGPNVVLIRFGGGVRRRECLDPQQTYCPYFRHELVKRGTFFPRMTIAQIKGLNTSHGEGTLNLVTGRYDQYKDIGNKFLGQRFEPKVPTLFEYLRKAYDVPPHQTLIVNGEDRPDEEFYTFSNHFAYGIDYRSTALSLYRFKSWLMQRKIEEGRLSGQELTEEKKKLEKWDKVDYRTQGKDRQGPEMESFWERWRAFYGESGLVNPRGDRLLTELAVRAMQELSPRLIMVNYNDCDYIHWGNMQHYTRGIAIMDEGLRQIVSAAESLEAYRGKTVFAIVPDCGRDSNPFVSVPCQHHFNSKSSHEIFALFFGPGVPPGRVVDRESDQICVAPTLAHLMGFKTHHAEGRVLEQAIA